LVCGGLREIHTLALVFMKFRTDIPTCPRNILGHAVLTQPPPPRPGGPESTQKAEGNIFEKRLENKRCSANCKDIVLSLTKSDLP